MRLYKIITIFAVVIFMLQQACEHAPVPTEIRPPASLHYTPQSLEITEGESGQSAVPQIAGSMPMVFTHSSTPAAGSLLQIDPQGVITISAGLAAGSYQISVQAENAAGSAHFPNVFLIEVQPAPSAPSALRYEPKRLELLAGTAGHSALPQLQGSSPLAFSISSSPDAGELIHITEQGVIAASDQLPAGTYQIDVTASNPWGSTRFDGAYTLVISSEAQPPSQLTYSPNALSVDQGSAASSVVPAIMGTSPMSYSLSVSPDAGGKLSIDNQGVITAAADLPVGTYSISVTATNSAGSATFDAIYGLTVAEPVFTTFTKDVKPLISTYCANCHTTGPQTLYTNYQNAVANITHILDRIQRQQGSAGFMPKNGTKLSDQEINLIKKWQADGLKEN